MNETVGEISSGTQTHGFTHQPSTLITITVVRDRLLP